MCDGLNRIYCSWYFALQVLRRDPWQEIPRQGFISTSVCKIAAALVAAVEAAFAQGADTLLGPEHCHKSSIFAVTSTSSQHLGQLPGVFREPYLNLLISL